MSKIELNAAFENVRGKMHKQDSIIYRQKKYRSESGKVINHAAQEAYEVRNPRDYKKNPPQGAELLNIRSFAEASRLTTQLINAGKYTDEELAAMTPEEREQVELLRARLDEFKARFKAQLKVADRQAPVLSKTDPQYNPNSRKIQRRQYRVLNAFIRAMLAQTIRNK